MATPQKTALEHFNASAARYEASTGSFTRELARHLVDLSPPFGPDSHVLDNACGTGIVAQEIIFKHFATAKVPPKISCVDGAGMMVDMARAACTTILDMEDGAAPADMSFETMAGEELRFADDHFTHSFTNQGILFFKDGDKGASEIYRTLKPGGTAMITTWKHLPYVPIIKAAQKIVTPDAPFFRIPVSEKWFEASHLEKTLRDASFTDVEVHETVVHYAFKSMQELCEMILFLLEHMAPNLSEQQKTDLKKQFEIEAEKVRVKVNRLVLGDLEGHTEELVGLETVALVGVAKK